MVILSPSTVQEKIMAKNEDARWWKKLITNSSKSSHTTEMVSTL